MNKSYIAALALVGLCLTSCGSRKEEPVEAEMVPVEDAMLQDSLNAVAAFEAEVDSAFEALDIQDPKALEKGVKNITEHIETLYREGDVETAAVYLNRLQDWYKENKAKVKKTMKDSKVISDLLKDAKEARAKYGDKTSEIKDRAKAKAEELKDEYGDEVKEVADKAKEKAAEVTEKYGDDVKEAASKAKEAAGTATTKAKEATTKAKEAATKAKESATKAKTAATKAKEATKK